MSEQKAEKGEGTKSALRGLTRRHLLAGLGILAGGTFGGAAYMYGVEPRRLVRSENRVVMRALKGQAIRAVHLTDWHYSEDVPLDLIEAAVDQAVEEAPDCFLLTGDYVTNRFHDPVALLPLFKKLTAVAPTYAVMGNHDGGSWAGSTYGFPSLVPMGDVLKKAGVRWLQNEVTWFEAHGSRICIAGSSDYWTDDFAPEALYHAWKSADARETETICLSHNPDSKARLEIIPWRLLLCGHTHGGQLIVPFTNWRPFLPIRDKRFAEGLHEWRGRQIFVNRGVGNLHGGRINCPPELAVIDFVPAS